MHVCHQQIPPNAQDERFKGKPTSPNPQKKVRKETNRQMNKLLSPFYLLSFLKDPILILFSFTKPKYSNHINHEEESQYWNSTH
jgi:hypothetical protein